MKEDGRWNSMFNCVNETVFHMSQKPPGYTEYGFRQIHWLITLVLKRLPSQVLKSYISSVIGETFLELEQIAKKLRLNGWRERESNSLSSNDESTDWLFQDIDDSINLNEAFTHTTRNTPPKSNFETVNSGELRGLT